MTQVTYFEEGHTFSIEVNGHSGYAEAGKDIVCSAISILIQTLVEHMDRIADYTDNYIADGYVWLYAQGDITNFALDTIMTGFELLEAFYPDYIQVAKGCTLQTYPLR